MTATMNWFEVDKEGLAKLLERRGKEFVMFELLQNALDTDAKRIEAWLTSVPGRPYATIRIVDDHPNGWKNLDHAFTLFAESEKKGDPEKRGRFNLGEKLVLALCEEASISTTTGTVIFSGEGRRRSSRKTESGSKFEATLKMTREEYEQVYAAVYKLLPPEGVHLTFNGIVFEHRKPLRTIEAVLPTEIADAEGILRRSARKTKVEIVECGPREVGTIYEMGIPVVESGDKYHYNVQMKIPLNSDRDNVTPAYLKELRTLVLNEMYKDITPDDATSKWARDAMEGEVSKEAADQIVNLRFGEKRVSTDPNDPEGTKLAMSKGYTVIPPRAFSGAEWETVRKHDLVKPAGQVTPSPKPYGPDGKDINVLPEEKWTEGMKKAAVYAKAVAKEILGAEIYVRIGSRVTWPPAATYGPGELTFNLGRLGHAWFDKGPGPALDELLIHEFGHHYSTDHLSEQYHDAICRLGAKLTALALAKPEFFTGHGWRKA